MGIHGEVGAEKLQLTTLDATIAKVCVRARVTFCTHMRAHSRFVHCIVR